MSDDPGAKPERDRRADNLVELTLRLAALGLLLYGALVLIRPFITLVIWSVVLTVALYPGFERISRRLGGRRHLAAIIITTFSLLIVIGPASWLILDLIESIRRVVERLSSPSFSLPAPSADLKDWPLVGPQLYEFLELASTNLAEAAGKIAVLIKPYAGDLLGIAANAGAGILMFLASIIIAGFLFSPAPSLVRAMKSLSRRLAAERGEEFVNLAGATIRTVSRGVIGISALQAMLAGIGLAMANFPGTSFITSGVLILGIIQIGPAVILIPVIIWAWMSMGTTSAILLTAYIVPVTLVDNVLRPLVMGRGLKTPLLVILVGVIGGTLGYGITGVFLGPIILAVIWELLVAWLHEDEAASM
jgi:predicted PurR-regulated permease PerM